MANPPIVAPFAGDPLMRLLLILAVLLASLLPVAAQEIETRKYFRDWLAVCQADGYCSAISYLNPNPGGGRVADAWLRIGRHAQETYWEVSFTPIKVMADPSMPFTVLVDGKGETFTGAAEVAPYGAINDFFLLGTKAQSVMDQMMPGKTVEVTFTDDTGATAKADFSLAGLTAALIWIDETQGRLGSERVAEAPPVGLTPTLEAPAQPLAIDLRTAELVNLHTDNACSVRIDAASAGRISKVSLDQYHTLYIVPCEDFAYNVIDALYLATDEDVSTVTLPQSDASDVESNLVYGGNWDEVSGELSSSYKGGNGNCGSEGRWRWSAGAFQLIELRARETCDQSEDEWPVVARGN